MNVLQIIAHPNLEGGFTNSAAEAFRAGARSAGHEVTWYNLFHPDVTEINHADLVLKADHICFAYPCWWEMPPAKLVEYFQTVFVKGFAFDYDREGKRYVKLDIRATCLISMGQHKDLNTTNLREAMVYCGMIPQFVLFQGVSPNLTKTLADEYLALATRFGAGVR